MDDQDLEAGTRRLADLDKQGLTNFLCGAFELPELERLEKDVFGNCMKSENEDKPTRSRRLVDRAHKEGWQHYGPKLCELVAKARPHRMGDLANIEADDGQPRERSSDPDLSALQNQPLALAALKKVFLRHKHLRSAAGLVLLGDREADIGDLIESLRGDPVAGLKDVRAIFNTLTRVDRHKKEDAMDWCRELLMNFAPFVPLGTVDTDDGSIRVAGGFVSIERVVVERDRRVVDLRLAKRDESQVWMGAAAAIPGTLPTKAGLDEDGIRQFEDLVEDALSKALETTDDKYQEELLPGKLLEQLELWCQEYKRASERAEQRGHPGIAGIAPPYFVLPASDAARELVAELKKRAPSVVVVLQDAEGSQELSGTEFYFCNLLTRYSSLPEKPTR